ncbi:MAG: aminotransferase class I/II-fold pyridoxal phosphate-dependent enzyme [Nitrososphaerota archaeon]|nr:aminotransferase class I/II-fold pyridoxal phosphate-dependent enzyme [Nitrososphaerota archaeon]
MNSQVSQNAHGGEVFKVARQLGLDPYKIIDFSSSINPLGPPSSAVQRMKNAIRMIPHYPDITYYDFRKAVAKYVGILDPESVIEGNGSTELIYLFAELSLREGEKALIPVPAFSEYERAVRRRGGIPTHIGCRSDFTVDTKRVMDELGGRYKALFLSSPGNPSSKIIPVKDIFKIIERASELNVRVLLDETFIEFIDGNDELGILGRINEFPNLFVIRSLTKAFALAGLRIGYGLASRKFISLMKSIKIPWSVNILAQEASIAAMNDRAYLKRTKKLITRERYFLFTELEAIRALAPVEPEANFILVKLSGGHTAKELKSSLLKGNHILIRDCSSFLSLNESYFRISIKLRKENLALLSALKEALT